MAIYFTNGDIGSRMTAKTTTPTEVDEHNLNVKCTSLEGLLNETRIKLDKMEGVCNTLMSIRKVHESTGEVSPIDERTGAIMTDATRLEIYKAGIAEADRLLGLTSEEESD